MHFQQIYKHLYIMEYHKYLDDPYVIVVPLVYKNNVTDVKQYLDYDNARMLYVHKGNQLSLWFSGDKSQGMKPRRKLICV